MKRIVSILCLLCMLACMPTAFAEEPITLRFSWWGGDTRHAATLEALERYHELHPNITIEGEYGGFDSYYQKLLTQLASNTAPDIIQVDYQWTADLMMQQAPLTNIYDLTDKIDLSDFAIDAVKGYCGNDDYLIGVPVGINGRGIFYNKTFFETYGIEASDDWTWEDLIAAGEKVQSQNPDAHLLFMQGNAIPYLLKDQIKQKLGVDMFSEDYEMNFSEQDLVEAFETVQKLFESGTLPPPEELILYEGTAPEQIPNWLDGRWGMSVLSASNLPSIISGTSGFEIGTMRWIVAEGATESNITVAPTQMLAVNANSPYQDEICEFINWFLNDDEAIMISKDTRGVPCNTRAVEMLEADGLILPQVSAMTNCALAFPGTTENGVTLNSELTNMMYEAIYRVAYGRQTPAEAAVQLMDDASLLLEDLKEEQ